MIARLLLLAGFVALIAALVQWRVVDRETPANGDDSESPGYFLTGVDLQEFGADGALRNRRHAGHSETKPGCGRPLDQRAGPGNL